MRKYLTIVVLASVVAIVASKSCAVRSTDCTCTFADDDDGGEGLISKALTTTEILAGAAGALTPLLVGGTIFGIIKLKGRKKGMDRSESRNSQPPGYFSRRGSRLAPTGDSWD